MSTTDLTTCHNALSRRFADRELVKWLAEPAGSLDFSFMRDMMLATRLLGVSDIPYEHNGIIRKAWQHDLADCRMNLVFEAVADTAGQRDVAGFQFKVTKGDAVLLNGYDTRSYDSATGALQSSSSHHVSTSSGFAPLMALHQEIEEHRHGERAINLGYQLARALRTDLI